MQSPIQPKKTRQQKEQWGWRLEVMGQGLSKILKRGSRQYRGGLHKIGRLDTLCQL